MQRKRLYHFQVDCEQANNDSRELLHSPANLAHWEIVSSILRLHLDMSCVNLIKEGVWGERWETLRYMIVLYWNVRGLNEPLKQSEVQEVLKHHPTIFGWVETRVQHQNAMRIVAKLFPQYVFFANYNGHHNGRIWVFWLPSLNFNVLKSTSQFVHCSIGCGMNAFVEVVTFINGQNQVVLRQALCHDLCTDNMACSWVLLGDFNVVIS